MELAETTTAAPAAAPAPTPDSAPAGEPAPEQETRESRRERVIRRLRDGRSAATTPGGDQGADVGATEDAADSVPADHPTESAAAEVDKPKPEPKDDDDRDVELRISKLQRELKHAKADALELRQKADRHDAMQARIDKAKGDAYAAVELMPEIFGFDFGELADHIVRNEGQFRQQRKYAELPPDVREELEIARKERLEREQTKTREQQAAQQKERFERYKSSADKYLEQNKDDYPLSHAIGWGGVQMAQAALAQNTKDARALAEDLEQSLRRELSEALARPELIRALIAGNSDLGPKLQAALSPNKPNKSPAAASLRSGTQAARTEGPSALSNGVTASDTASERDRRTERKRRIAEAFKAQYGRR